jgi:hypothetical protein
MTRIVLLFGLLTCASALFASDGPHLFYSRAFPGSKPDYIQIVLEKNGDGVYQEAVDDELPLKFKLTDVETQTVFGLADKLERFKRQLETPMKVKVAFMGTKTFRFVNGDEKTEVQYNFSEDVSAQQLQDWFERMAESAQHRIDLERAAKYDHLGVDGALQGLEAAFENDRIVSPEQFLPMLDRIAKNETYMHQSRARASEMADAIRNLKK